MHNFIYSAYPMTPQTVSSNKKVTFFKFIRQSFQNHEYNYTKSSLRQAIVLLAILMILELRPESVFAVVDMFFVGKPGENTIATVGLTESVVALVYALAIG